MEQEKNNFSSKRLKKISILKNIFLSTNEDELFNAFLELNSDIKIDKTELESDYNKYFIGPDSPIAPPYASIYIDEENALMTKTTMHIRNLYEIMGFKNSLKNKIPEDQLGLELDAYYQLLYIELEKDIKYLQNLRIYFLKEHINIWIFKFINRVLEHKEKSSNAINLIIKELNSFFQNELKIKGEIL